MGSNYFSMQFPRLVAANHFSKRLNPESTQMINPKTKKNRVLSILNKNALRPSMSGSFLLFRRRTGEQLHPVFTCFIRPCRTRREEKKRTGCGESAPAVGNEKMTKKKGNKNPETKVNAVSFSNDLSALFFLFLYTTHTHTGRWCYLFSRPTGMKSDAKAKKNNNDETKQTTTATKMKSRKKKRRGNSKFECRFPGPRFFAADIEFPPFERERERRKKRTLADRHRQSPSHFEVFLCLTRFN